MKNFIFPLLVFLFFLFASILGLSAQDISGSWNGKVNLGGTDVRLIFHFEKDGDSNYHVKMDSPDQGANGIPVTSAAFADSKLKLKIDNIGFLYNGTLKGDTLFEGSFVQMGSSFPLNLKRGEVKLNRPQEPKKPYSYKSEDVFFENKSAGITLAGTFTSPPDGKKHPAVVLITGSGPQNRDEEMLGHKPFLVLSDYLTRNGISVLRFDDRGFAQSKGDYQAATSADFMADVLAGVDYLKTRKDVDTKKIGLIGHSEGSMIAFMAAAGRNDISYLVSLAGTGVAGDSILLLQARSIPQSLGATKEMTEDNAAVTRKAINSIKGNSADYVKVNLAKLIEDALPKGDSWLNADLTRKNFAASYHLMNSPWGRFFMSYDPSVDLKRVKCPVLAINGDKDIQVDATINLFAIQKGLEAGGNKKLTVEVYPGLNHLFQTCKACGLGEYGMLEETISPVVLHDVAKWIVNVTK